MSLSGTELTPPRRKRMSAFKGAVGRCGRRPGDQINPVTCFKNLRDELWKELRNAFVVSSASSSRASRQWSTSAIAATANDDQARLGAATPIFQKNTFVWMDRIKFTPAPATLGHGLITISVRTAGSLFVGPVR